MCTQTNCFNQKQFNLHKIISDDIAIQNTIFYNRCLFDFKYSKTKKELLVQTR